MLYFYFGECERRKVIVLPNLLYFLAFSLLFYGMELMMFSRNDHTNMSLKLACFEAEKDGRSEVYEIRFTTGLAEAVFVYYRADRGAHRRAGWLTCLSGFAPEIPVARGKVHRHPLRYRLPH